MPKYKVTATMDDEEDDMTLVLYDESPVFKTTEFAYTKRKMEEDEDAGGDEDG